MKIRELILNLIRQQETPYEGPGTYSPAELDIKVRVVDEKEKVFGRP